MGNGFSPDVRLGNALHLNGGLNPDGNSPLLQAIRHRQGVDGGSQHAHMIGPGPFHAAGAVFEPSPEISPADDNAHLNSLCYALAHGIADPADGVEIQAAVLAAGQGFSAEF